MCIGIPFGFYVWRLINGTDPKRPLRLFLLMTGLAATFFLRRPHGTLPAFASEIGLVLAIFFSQPIKPRQFVWLAILCNTFFVATLITYPRPLTYVYAGLGLWFTVSCLVASSLPLGQPWSRGLKKSVLLLLQSLPIVVILIAIFPRQNGEFFHWLQKDNAQTGFTNYLSPGQILRLSTNDAVVFRAALNDESQVTPNQLYWRGLVMWDTDGLRWFNASESPLESPALRSAVKGVKQDIVLEPQDNLALFGLEIPLSIHLIDPDDLIAKSQRENTFALNDVVSYPIHYVVRSLPTHTLGIDGTVAPVPTWSDPPVLKADEREHALRVPPDLGARVEALAKSFTANSHDPRVIIQKALANFASNGFVYTFTPGRRYEDLDSFLFDGRRGFCAHYAAAFANLLRLTGIPTRVVAGYLGGTYNAVGHYWIVRQEHAHAWVEAWLDDAGWVRVDPTAVVALERITSGEPWMYDESTVFWSKVERHLKLYWDGVGFVINRFFIDPLAFEDDYKTGHTAWQKYIPQGVALALSLWICIALLFSLRKRWKKNPMATQQNALTSAYNDLCQKMANEGVARLPHEGPLDYGRKILRSLPKPAPEIERVFSDYALLHYGRAVPAREEIKKFRRDVVRTVAVYRREHG